MRELENGQEQIARFIPRYLGRLLSTMPEKEIRESIDFLDGPAAQRQRPRRLDVAPDARQSDLRPAGKQRADGALPRPAADGCVAL